MSARAISALIGADSRLLWRDPLLAWMLLVPVGLGVALRALLPAGREALLSSGGVDLAAYYPLILGGYVMSAPGIVGMIVGFMLLDERDARTLTALRVTPLSIRRYLAYRIALPLVAGIATTVACYPIAGVVALPFETLVSIALVAGLWAPLLALILATAAPNKVAGFAVMKVLNSINLLPIVAYFLPVPLQYAFGVLPPYWPMRALWSASAGEAHVWYLVAGAVSGVLAIAGSARLFERRMLRRGD